MGDIHLRPPGSGTQEYKGYNVISEIMIPIWQATWIGIVVGVSASVVGWLIIQAGPVVLSIVIGLVLGVILFLAMRLAMHVDSRIATVVAALLATVGMVRIAEMLSRLSLWDAEWYRRVLVAIVGFGWLGPAVFGGLIVFRFWHEVTQHQFVPAPGEKREVRTYIPVPQDLRPPVINGGGNRLLPARAAAGGPMLDSDPIETPIQSIRTADEQQRLRIDFYDFVRLAAERGLTRGNLVTDPRIRLAGSGQRLTRGVYDTFIEEMQAHGWIVRGGDGSSTEWVEEWQADPSPLLQWLAGKVGLIEQSQNDIAGIG